MMAQRRDGTKFSVELSITRISIADRPFFTGYVRDITDRKLAEEQQSLFINSNPQGDARAHSIQRRIFSASCGARSCSLTAHPRVVAWRIALRHRLRHAGAVLR